MNGCGVYLIVNKINGHRYVGSARDIRDRWKAHRSALHRKVHHSKHLQNAWNLYGETSFEFLHVLQCPASERVRLEQESLDRIKPEYNHSTTASGPHGFVKTAAYRAKLSAASRANWRRAAYRKNVIEGLRLVSATDAHREVLSRAHKGIPKSSAHKMRIALAHLGRKRSPEHCAAIKEGKRKARMAKMTNTRWEATDGTVQT